MKQKTRAVTRVLICAAIVVAALAAAVGIYQIININFLYNEPVFTGYGFQNDIYPLEKITLGDMEMVDNVLTGHGISYRLLEDEAGSAIFVQGYNWEKASALLQTVEDCGYEFDGCALS